MRLLIAGDTHGDIIHINNLCARAKKMECDAVVEAGDFGYWGDGPHSNHNLGMNFLNKVEKVLSNHDINLFWLDGNHENHTDLRERYIRGQNDFIEIRERLFHLPRGFSWRWDGVKFMSFGGAYSVDKASRHEYTSWWPEETITAGEVYSMALREVDEPNVDILLTHDCPLEVRLADIVPGFYKMDQDTATNRKMVSEVVDLVKPRLLIHGHYHYRYHTTEEFKHGRVQIEGLDCNMYKFENSFIVIDTDDWRHE